jgi:Xaa-Pro dipeptidase
VSTTGMSTPNLGTGAMEDRDRIHFADLRRARRQKVIEEMAGRELDAMVLGREGNVRYASGARRLWTAQSRPFSPTCAVIRATNRVELMSFSASYEGMPEEVQPDDFFAVTWNPGNFVERFAAIPELHDARRVGFDGLSPFFEGLMRQAFPQAEFVGAEDMMRQLRRRKLDEEIVCLRTAAALAESALYAAAAEIRPGVPEKHLQATFLARMCELGTSQFSQQGTFTAIDPGGQLRWITGPGSIDEGALVALAGGVLWAGYEGSLARTWWCGKQRRPTPGQKALYHRWRELADALVDTCRVGRNGTDLRAVYARSGEEPVAPIAYSIGLGHEGTIAGPGLSPQAEDSQTLEAGMVLGVRAFVTGTEGGYLGEDMVLVTESGPERLTRLGYGPLAEDAH